MKQKIKSALEQGYKNLGIGDEAFERVAALGETFIKEESQIAEFVKNAEGTLKLYQSEADKIRTELNGKIKTLEGEKAGLEARLNKGGEPKADPKSDVKDEPKKEDPVDMAKLIADAVAQAVKPLNDKIEAFESGQATKKALDDAEALFNSNDWVKKYKDEAADAWERAVEVNTLGGSKMTADELNTKAMGYFAKAVKRKGEDVSQPFKAEGANESEPDFSPFDRAVAAMKAAKGEAPESETK